MKSREEYIILADAGGTKTDWFVFYKEEGDPLYLRTPGINATTSSDQVIYENFETLYIFLCKRIPNFIKHKLVIRYFGAGCNSDETKSKIFRLLKVCLKECNLAIDVRSDIEEAGLALFGDGEGIACILGTGSASCFYIQGRIKEQVPSLGYILGDEGSAASMCKELLNAYYKKELNEDLCEKLRNEYPMNMNEILDNVYRREGANRYLAEYFTFLYQNRHHPDVNELIERSLKLFFEKNVLKYKNYKNYPVRFCGGVAYLLKEKVMEIGRTYDLNVDNIIHNPLDEILDLYWKA